jgi:hypothetical protein
MPRTFFRVYPIWYVGRRWYIWDLHAVTVSAYAFLENRVKWPASLLQVGIYFKSLASQMLLRGFKELEITGTVGRVVYNPQLKRRNHLHIRLAIQDPRASQTPVLVSSRGVPLCYYCSTGCRDINVVGQISLTQGMLLVWTVKTCFFVSSIMDVQLCCTEC